MIQLTLRTDAIEGLCAAISYFIDAMAVFKEINMCFLFEKAPANQAIHILQPPLALTQAAALPLSSLTHHSLTLSTRQIRLEEEIIRQSYYLSIPLPWFLLKLCWSITGSTL